MTLLCRLLGHRHAMAFTHDRRLLVCQRCLYVEDDGPVLRPEHGHAAIRAQGRQAAQDARIVEERERRAEAMGMRAQDTRKPRLVRSR